jgi:hypothetical protein
MSLFLECKPDEALALAVGVPRRAIFHSYGKGRVSKYLGKHRSVKGLVDEDFGSAEPKTLSQFVEISAAHDVRLKHDKARNNRLVIVCPELEHWVIKTAKATHIKMENYSLSENPQELHEIVNQRLPNLTRLLNDLLIANSPRLLHLKSLLVD